MFNARSVMGLGIVAAFSVVGAFAQTAAKPADATKATETKATGAATADTKTPGSDKDAKKPEAKPAPAGVLVFVDPVTHEIRPPLPGEVEQLTGLQVQSLQTVTSEQQAARQFATSSGAVGLKLDDSYATFMVVTKGPDGKLTMTEGNNADAEKAVKNGAAAPVKSELTVKKGVPDVK
jgi:hypothetical protein